jgi:hypothetical protein
VQAKCAILLVHNTEVWAFVSFHCMASLFLIFKNQSALFSVRDIEQDKLWHLSPYCVCCILLVEPCTHTSDMMFDNTSAVSMLQGFFFSLSKLCSSLRFAKASSLRLFHQTVFPR